MTMGRPPLYKTAEDLEVKINEYFESCDNHTEDILGKGPGGETVSLTVRAPQRYTVPGLAYFLGFYDDESVLYQAKRGEDFSATIKRARKKIEAQRAADLTNPNTKNARGIQFDLTNNFGWKDRQEIEHSGFIASDEAANEAYKRRVGLMSKNLSNGENSTESNLTNEN